MRTGTSLLLLLFLGLTLGLGAHPCGAEGAPAPAARAAMPSCPMHAEPSATLRAGSHNHDCCGSASGSGSHQPCPHLCHATALPVVATPPFQTDLTARPLLAVDDERPLAAPVRAIDHVPLG